MVVADALSSKREAILDAALALFCELTFDGTPVPLVAERANVGAGTIYRYFDSKEALVNAVYQRWKTEMKRALIDEAPRGTSAREEFRHYWRGLWRFATEHRLAFAFLEMHHHAPYLDAESHAVGAELAAGTLAFVERAQAAGAIRRMQPHVLIALVFGAFTGLVKASAAAGTPIDEPTIVATEDAVWEMITAASPSGE
jgi:AcrR family transcriptional regulator